ncbi:MAG TPA: ArsR family transcriptional regulator [Actinobacteria bacterium]|nr:ArsR family transcriptional regulator [Actinomycetes bacterium]HEX21051.1 ArsR family transcriptional regulator [Actinomycetota bacterium]
MNKSSQAKTLSDTQLTLASKTFRGFADPTRLKILHYLMEKERSVSELVDLLEAPQGRVSNHLACLRWCNFVSTSRRGKYVYYQLTDERVKDILKLIYEFINDNAAHIYSCTRM